MNWWSLVALALLGSVTLAGCVSSPTEREDLEARVQVAVAELSAALSPDAGTGVRAIVGYVEAYGDDGSFERFADLSAEVHLNDSTSMTFEMSLLGGYSVAMWCTPTEAVVETPAGLFKARPFSDGTSDSSCTDDEDVLSSPAAFLDQELLEELGEPEITEHDNGSVTARFPEAADMELTLHIALDGRVRALEFRVDEVRLVFDVIYGVREPIDLPEATERLPALVRTSLAGRYSGWSEVVVSESANGPPLVELEAHWWEPNPSKTGPTVRAAFPLDGESHESDGFTFRFEDVDGDARLTVGDRWVVSAGDDGESSADGYYHAPRVHLFDLWADGYTSEELPFE